jgi:hypothetical protein
MAKKNKKAAPAKKVTPKKVAPQKVAVKKTAAKKAPPRGAIKKGLDATSTTGKVTMCGEKICLDDTPMVCGTGCLTSNFDKAVDTYGCKVGKQITVQATPDACDGVDVLRVPAGPC